MHACMHACMHAHTHMHIYIPTYLPTHLHTYKHTYILAGMSRWGSSCRLLMIVAMANMTVMATVTIFSWNEVGILKRDHLVDQPCRGRFAFWQTRYNEVGFAQETTRLYKLRTTKQATSLTWLLEEARLRCDSPEGQGLCGEAGFFTSVARHPSKIGAAERSARGCSGAFDDSRQRMAAVSSSFGAARRGLGRQV